MASAGGGAPPEFMSTHPSDETRMKKIREQIPEAMAVLPPQIKENECPVPRKRFEGPVPFSPTKRYPGSFVRKRGPTPRTGFEVPD
jgi:hypothetical protein